MEPSIRAESNSEREGVTVRRSAENFFFEGEDGMYFEEKGLRILQVDEPDMVRRKLFFSTSFHAQEPVRKSPIRTYLGLRAHRHAPLSSI